MKFNRLLLATMRKDRKWSRRVLSEASGVSSQSIWKIESGKTVNPESPTVTALAAAFGVSPGIFFELDTNAS